MTESPVHAPAVVKVLSGIASIEKTVWDRAANATAEHYNPFVSYNFLKALEDAGCVGPGTGWTPSHLMAEENGRVSGFVPAYVKTHSQGEYVFDYGWADAYERAGGQYYPKLQIAVPFTPVPGPRLLRSNNGLDAANNPLLASAIAEIVTQSELSSAHVTFCDEATAGHLGRLGYLVRHGQQFHWSNAGYRDFDDFLATFASRKRKAVRKERAEVTGSGIEIELVTGPAITEAHWDAMFAFYIDTGNRKWGRPYLKRRFFSLLGETMCEQCLLILAKRDGAIIAGALNLIGGDCLYGRYWGASEHHPCLHFELCYYQAIDYAIRHKLARVEAGAQGEHKLARGYLPVTTYSAHWIADEHLRRAIARFLNEERRAVAAANTELRALAPYRHGETCAETD